MKIKKLITGWSRGGLGYVYQLLKEAGFDVGLSFNDVITESDFDSRLGQAREIEISSRFSPFLGHEALKGVEPFFITRNPMRVLNSLYHLGIFHNEKPSELFKFASHNLPGIRQYRGMPSQASAYYIRQLFRQALLKTDHSIKVFKLEEGPEHLFEQLKLKPDALPFLLPEVNSTYCLQNHRFNNLLIHSKDYMRSLMRRLGYSTERIFPACGNKSYISSMWEE